MKIGEHPPIHTLNINGAASGDPRDVLKKACQDFESILLAQTWKKMMTHAREIGGRKDEDRPFGVLEDLSVEMASEALAGQNDNGLWKVLYDSLSSSLQGDEGDTPPL
ncbi:MAG: hypothetical protein CSA35_04820 [Dethiosulfovibrio peptidovorans]|nr:MAG: hypothetical protein CSA35_04820 [Dethiosulfovibrio peptidovorans]